MRRAFVATLSATLVGGLILAAISGGATARVSDEISARGLSLQGAQYKGEFKDAGPDTKIEIKAAIRRGEAKAIKKMIFVNLPADCPETKFDTISGGWTLAGVKVNNRRRFRAVGHDGNPPATRSSLRFTGRFNRAFSKVRGKFQTTSYFPATGPPDNLPAETCVGETKRYVAR